MLAILSPAKSLNETPVSTAVPRTEHAFTKDTSVLLKSVQRLKTDQMRSLMGISEKLATLNIERHKQMSVPVAEDALAAAHLFDGDVYKGFDARSLPVEDLEWSADRVAILSGLYGLLRPLDRTHPYRLEMGTKLKTRRGTDLYAFWGDRIAKRINTLVSGHEDPVVVDLASKEYSSAIRKRALKVDWLTVQFKEIRDGKPKIISFFAKKARGLMARHIVANRLTDREQLKSFDAEGYRFDPELSSAKTLVFTRAS